ncbi:jg19955 [Pararge aegeria aegeria]|uniref:Jg19955 protein n=1 Tax=Pararge aegeria aegeria TaxID=348720 RepID=A0A8S4RXA8_9NEOP|nr:jg19955 [Pararge aegeria aegeria]
MGRRGVARTPQVCALFICTTRNPKVCTAALQRGFLEQRHQTLPLAARPLKQNLWAPTSIAGFPRLLRQYRNWPGKQGNGNGRPRVGGAS